MSTVDTYWRRIRARFESTSRTEAVAKALNLKSAGAMTMALQENDRLILEMHKHLLFEQELQNRILSERVIAAERGNELQVVLEHLWRTQVLLGNLGAVLWWAQPGPPWTIDWISDSVAQWGYSADELKQKKPLLALVHGILRSRIHPRKSRQWSPLYQVVGQPVRIPI